MDAVVLGDGVLGLRRRDLGEGLLQVLGRHRRVEPLQRREQPGPDQQLVPGLALAPAGRDVLPGSRPPAERLGQAVQAPCLPSRLRKRLLRVLLSRVHLCGVQHNVQIGYFYGIDRHRWDNDQVSHTGCLTRWFIGNSIWNMDPRNE